MRVVAILALVTLTGCGEARMYGQAAAEYRREMNDLQAQGTMAAICDLSLGSYWRQLTAAQRQMADLTCGADQQQLPAQLRAMP